MKALIYLFLIGGISMSCYGQRFFTSTNLTNFDLDNYANFSNCQNPGSKAIQFTVSGLNTLTSSFSLAAIDLSFNLSCGENYRNLDLWIAAPNNGPCMQIYNYDESSSNIYRTENLDGTITGTFNLSLRDGSCLNLPNVSLDWAINTNKTATGNYGAFKANQTQDISAVFNNINPNGTWTIYASETSDFAPCISSASILFGNPVVANETTKGESCESPIVWSGQPICASSQSKLPSTQSPGFYQPNNGPSGYESINGNNCQWNAANNNDVWVKFTSTGAGIICISINGLDAYLQSIVVKDARADGDNNPCTQKAKTKQDGDLNWHVVSCPSTNSIIYDANNVGGGTAKNQQHCFTAQLNETFYLVIDGTSGAQSPFYITGISGPLPAILSNENEPFIRNIQSHNKPNITMDGTRLQSKVGNRKIQQQIFIYNAMGRLYYQTNQWVSGSSELNLLQNMHNGLNIIKVVMSDGSGSEYTFKINKQ